jgi:hypothetical protein
MVRLSEAERRHLQEMANSQALREACRRLSLRGQPPPGVTPDEFLAWLQAYNDCINHARKPGRRFLDRDLRL